MAKQKYQIGMIGLGVMGRNLVLNIADHGYSVSGYDKDLIDPAHGDRRLPRRSSRKTAGAGWRPLSGMFTLGIILKAIDSPVQILAKHGSSTLYELAIAC